MDEAKKEPVDAFQLQLTPPEPIVDPRGQAVLDLLKVQPTDGQVEVRKRHYRRQGFVPAGMVWRGLLLTDAVDRVIAEKLGLPFHTTELPLADLVDAKLWVLEHALENPQLNPFQRIRVQLQRKSLLEDAGRERMAAGGKGLTEVPNLPPHNTRREIAKAANSSEGQVQKVECLLESANPDVLTQLETGTIKIGAAFDALRPHETPSASDSCYGVLYLDLPCGITTKRLRAMPLSDLACQNAAIFCWTHPSDLVKTLGLVRKWGFKYVTHFVLPLGKALMQDFVQERHDVLILATRGEVTTPALEDLPSTVLPEVSGPDRPEAVFAMIEQLFPETAKVQICPRQPRAGWSERDLRGDTEQGS